MNKHLIAIRSARVEKTNIIGIRKALNAYERKACGYSVSRTAPKITADEVTQIERALADIEPRVVGELRDSGIKQLRNRRYAKRLASVLDIVNSDDLQFHLVAFDRLGTHGLCATPVYRAVGHQPGRSFLFRNVPWQSGGNGPEVLNIIN